MAARVPAYAGMATSVAKAVRDQLGHGDAVVVATHTEIGDAVADHLASPGCRDLLTRFVTELHAAGLDGEARPSGGEGRG